MGRKKTSLLDGEDKTAQQFGVTNDMSFPMPPSSLLASQRLPTTPSTDPPESIFRVERSALFSRLDSFLPQMKQANDQLEKDIALNGPEMYNIENISRNTENVVKMDLTLGVLEEKNEKNGTLVGSDVIVASKNSDVPADVEFSANVRNTLKAVVFGNSAENESETFTTSSLAHQISQKKVLISDVTDGDCDSIMNDDDNDMNDNEEYDMQPRQYTREELGFEPVNEVPGGGYDSKSTLIHDSDEGSNSDNDTMTVKDESSNEIVMREVKRRML